MTRPRQVTSIFSTKTAFFQQKGLKSWKRLENFVPLQCQNEGG